MREQRRSHACCAQRQVPWATECTTLRISAVAALGKVVDISVVKQKPFPTVQTVQQAMEILQLLLNKVPDVPVWQVLRVPQVQAVMMTVVISQLHLVDAQMVWSPRPLSVWAPQGAVHRLRDELKGGLFKAVCTGTRPGRSCPQGDDLP